jgi:hypothetical protein
MLMLLFYCALFFLITIVAVGMFLQRRASPTSEGTSLGDNPDDIMTEFGRKTFSMGSAQARHMVDDAFEKPRDY